MITAAGASYAERSSQAEILRKTALQKGASKQNCCEARTVAGASSTRGSFKHALLRELHRPLAREEQIDVVEGGLNVGGHVGLGVLAQSVKQAEVNTQRYVSPVKLDSKS